MHSAVGDVDARTGTSAAGAGIERGAGSDADVSAHVQCLGGCIRRAAQQAEESGIYDQITTDVQDAVNSSTRTIGQFEGAARRTSPAAHSEGSVDVRKQT